MLNSHFVTASGLDAEGHYVTVRDMSILARYAYSIEELRTIMATEEKTLYTVDKSVSYQLENTNLLIHTPRLDGNGEPYTGASYLYEYATGMKTGSHQKFRRLPCGKRGKRWAKVNCLDFWG